MQVLMVKTIVFPVVMYGWESWTIKKTEYRRTDIFKLWLEKTLQSPLDCKKIQPVHLKGNQSWVFFGRTDAEAEAPILWLPDAKNWLIWKDADSGKDWGQEEKGTTEDEMVGWNHWFDGHEFEQGPGAGDGQGSLACCSPRGCKESDMTEWMNWEKGLSIHLTIVIRSLSSTAVIIGPTRSWSFWIMEGQAFGKKSNNAILSLNPGYHQLSAAFWFQR